MPASADKKAPEPAPLAAVLYGSTAAPFVAPIVRDICRAAARNGTEVLPLAVEDALRHPARCARVGHLYILPFDLPPAETDTPKNLARRLFRNADVINPMEAHELCWDRITAAERLLSRGIAVPESLVTNSPEEARAFVSRHEFVVLKERHSCGGLGDVVLCDSKDVLVGEAGGRRFAVELASDPGTRRRLEHGVLAYPPPFYLQRIAGAAGRRGAFTPGPVLRAYVANGQVAFWTERYRERYRRPSDWLLSAALGARHRFVLETSDEVTKTALRAAEVLRIRIGAVDLTRIGGAGPYVLEADTDGVHMYIDRRFKELPDYREPFDFDRLIAAALAGAPAES